MKSVISAVIWAVLASALLMPLIGHAQLYGHNTRGDFGLQSGTQAPHWATNSEGLMRYPFLFRVIIISLLVFSNAAIAESEGLVVGIGGESPVSSGLPLESVPDIRKHKMALKLQKGSFVAVPIPMSSPTFGAGLIAGGAYFYPQTAEQRKSQPASVTAAAAGYTNNDSYFYGVVQQNYWDKDTWRFTGMAGHFDFKLKLRDPEASDNGDINWLVDGNVVQASLSRQVASNWYVGTLARYLDITQDLATSVNSQDFGIESKLKSAGVGVTLEYDARDVPSNAYGGSYFQSEAVFSAVRGGQDSPYQSYYLRYRNYHELGKRLVLASDISGCTKSGNIPLWDTCRINLRGFAVTDYLGKSSLLAQAAGRWRVSPRWGFVVFAGGGVVSKSFSDDQKSQLVPSYGAGIRFMVLKAKRINLRVDYARSTNSSAWYVAVGEAF